MEMSSHTVISLGLGDRGYDILVGGGLLADAAAIVGPHLARPQTAVITDETVAFLQLATLRGAFREAGIACTEIIVPPGEGSKSFAQLERVLDQLLDARIERGDCIIALGGGVVGDLAGFAASILRRGTGVVQVPTTLLAQVDSAVGGKTGINARQGKNLIGTFHQPRLVVVDVNVLETLPKREFLAGYAEVVKYGLIADAAFFAWLEANGPAAAAGDADARRHAIVESCRAKARVVEADERETGQRALLNLGHTFAHAFEAEAGYDGSLLHGEAVAVGLVMAFQLSARLGLCPGADAARVQRHLSAMGLPTTLRSVKTGWDMDRIAGRMTQDKKSRQGVVQFVLVRGIGKAFLSSDVTQADVMAVLRQDLAA
ncbi:MAG: 3-dehydroquinate synthase [Proteobacteria bacterium]|nr:3-dehydroquinate synthase [Pseudomonadota bacterium]